MERFVVKGVVRGDEKMNTWYGFIGSESNDELEASFRLKEMEEGCYVFYILLENEFSLSSRIKTACMFYMCKNFRDVVSVDFILLTH